MCEPSDSYIKLSKLTRKTKSTHRQVAYVSNDPSEAEQIHEEE